MTHIDTVETARRNVPEVVYRCLQIKNSRDRNEALHAEAWALYLEGGARELLDMASELGVPIPKQVYEELPSSPP